MMPRPPQPNGSLHIKIDEVGNNSQLIIYHLSFIHKVEAITICP